MRWGPEKWSPTKAKKGVAEKVMERRILEVFFRDHIEKLGPQEKVESGGRDTLRTLLTTGGRRAHRIGIRDRATATLRVFVEILSCEMGWDWEEEKFTQGKFFFLKELPLCS